MTQIDLLRHAKSYLEQLNYETDPVSGSRLPSGSAGWETEVKRQIFFCAKNLETIINYDDVNDRPPFSITAEEKGKVVPADRKVKALDLVNVINRAVDRSRCRGLGQTTLLDWLVEEGYLQRGKKWHETPTPKGKSVGLMLVTSKRGAFLLFDRSAQQFVIDHLDDLVEKSKSSTTPVQKTRKVVDHPEILKGNLRAMRLLSQGFHPYSGEPLKPEDPLGGERLRKCFDYVAQALARTLEAGYFTAKGPFTLPRELWGEIPVTEEPVTMGEFTVRANKMLPDPTAVQGLSILSVQEYLVSQGLLQEVLTEKGRKTRKVTDRGSAVGITCGERVDKEGKAFTTLLYGPDAQRYLREHMGELIAFIAR